MTNLLRHINNIFMSNPFRPSIEEKFFDEYAKRQAAQRSVRGHSVYTFASRPHKMNYR